MTTERAGASWLLVATFVIAIAGLVYELIAATASSYLLGDSVRQFSLVIGVFLSSMGLGAWASRFVVNPINGFIRAQIALGLVGGFSASVIFATYAAYGIVGVPLYGVLVIIGVLSGMEIPLIARVLEHVGARTFRFENVLTADYLGALAASLAFPFLVVPYLGLMSASLVFGCANLAVAGVSLWLFRKEVALAIWPVWAGALLLSLVALLHAERLVSVLDAALYEDDIILSEQTSYQSIIVTRFRDRTRLFLDGAIQFDSRDEHRYHEALVHPALASVVRPRHVLILGGGDGMALREVLKHDGVEAVTLVDLDPRVTEIFRDVPGLAALNDHALSDPRVRILNEDAWSFVAETDLIFDAIVADLPDPKNLSLSKLYSREFYRLIADRLRFDGVFVTQAGSPLFARKAFWSVVVTLEAVPHPSELGETLSVVPYRVHVPSFGEWGFALAHMRPKLPEPMVFPTGLRFLDGDVWRGARAFPLDSARLPVEPNSIHAHPLPRYYREGWAEWYE